MKSMIFSSITYAILVGGFLASFLVLFGNKTATPHVPYVPPQTYEECRDSVFIDLQHDYGGECYSHKYCVVDLNDSINECRNAFILVPEAASQSCATRTEAAKK